MKVAIAVFLHAAVALAAPSRKTKCRPAAPGLPMVVREDNVIDLTHEFNENNSYYPSHPYPFQFTEKLAGKLGNLFFRNNYYRQPEHFGTHIDAPNHFFKDGVPIQKVRITGHLIGEGYLINMKKNGERLGADSLVTIEDIRKFEKEYRGRIRTGGIVLIYTGYGEQFYNREVYMGTNMTGLEAIPFLHFPGLDPKAADWLITNRCIGAIGIDTVSIDYARATDAGSHIYLSRAGVPIFENVAHPDKVAEYGKNSR